MPAHSTAFKHKQRIGFTLVELLVVIGIIAALAGLTVGIQTRIQRQQAIAQAQAEVQAIALGLEQFKAMYGDYPWIRFALGSQGSAESPDKKTDARLLYQALTGQAKLVAEHAAPGGQVSAIYTYSLDRISDHSGVSDQPGPMFVDPSKMTVYDGFFFADNPNFVAENAYFVDPWGNAYEYFYIRSGTRPNPDDEFAHWKSKNFVLLSLGSDGAHDVRAPAIASMLSQGKTLSNPGAYFEAESDGTRNNIDNIVHGFNY